MPEYMAVGRLVLDGVRFFVEAETEEEARAKFDENVYESYDIVSGETVDWDIYARSTRQFL